MLHKLNPEILEYLFSNWGCQVFGYTIKYTVEPKCGIHSQDNGLNVIFFSFECFKILDFYIIKSLSSAGVLTKLQHTIEDSNTNAMSNSCTSKHTTSQLRIYRFTLLLKRIQKQSTVFSNMVSHRNPEG